MPGQSITLLKEDKICHLTMLNSQYLESKNYQGYKEAGKYEPKPGEK